MTTREFMKAVEQQIIEYQLMPLTSQERNFVEIIRLLMLILKDYDDTFKKLLGKSMIDGVEQ